MFKVIASFKKDILPLRLFGFGTIVFPHGCNTTDKIVIYGIELNRIDEKLLILEKREKIFFQPVNALAMKGGAQVLCQRPQKTLS